MHLLFDLLAFLQAQLGTHADAMLLPAAVILGVPMLAAAAWPVATKHLRTALRTARVRRAGSVEAPRVHAAGEDGVTGDPMDLLNAFARQRKSHVIVLGGDGAGSGTTDTEHQTRPALEVAPVLFHRAYKIIPKDMPIDIILHNKLALGLSTTRCIAKLLQQHRGPVTVFVPFRVFGSACLLALAAREIIMSPDAALFFDTQCTRSSLKAARLKGRRNMSDTALFDLHFSIQRARETEWLAGLLLKGRGILRWRSIARMIGRGDYHETNPVHISDLRKWGLNARTLDANETKDLGLLRGAGVLMYSNKRAVAAAGPTMTDLAPVCAAACPAGPIRSAMLELEARRKTKVISLIHDVRMSEKSLGAQTTAEALRAIRATAAGTDLDIILHTPGGSALGAAQLTRALKEHRGRKTFFVPYDAFSAGTILALTGDEIFLSEAASLGPIDAQIDDLPAAAWASLLQHKKARNIDHGNLIMALEARDSMAEDYQGALQIMKGNYPRGRARRIAHTLNDGHLSHAFPIMYDDARQIGLNVRLGVPDEVFTIVDHFLEQGDGHCSVVHCSG